MRSIAWAGALLFAGSLAGFAYFFGVVLGRAAPPAASAVPDPAAIAFNIALFSVFALHHSVLARSGIKARLSRLIPPPLERSSYVWIASLLFIGVCALWQPMAGVAWEVHGPLRFVFYAVQAAGVVLTLRSAALIDIWDLAGVAQVSRTGQPAGTVPVIFKTAGPYGWLRHPIYLGWVLIVCAAPAMTAGRALFAGISTLYLVVAIPLEERSLVQAHGEDYRRYQRQVRWRLLPGIW